jgi:uncharacterized pyridoxal phosphate-containing UPF0001 family protein
VLEQGAELSGVAIQGLMCMAPQAAPPAEVRAVFRRLKELRDEPAHRRYLGSGELSLGMSGDFEFAVEEGATQVRLGSTLFGRR